MVIWFTGVSGSGKTTLGKKFFNILKKNIVDFDFFLKY